MVLFPAIDLYGGNIVRLTRGDFTQMTVYSGDPLETARGFFASGAEYLHAVDLEGARDGTTPNIETVRTLAACSGLNVEIGGGIRTREVAERYLDAGVFRIVLGTAAVRDPGLLRSLVRDYGDKVAVGVDVLDGKVAIKGWTEYADVGAFDFCRDMVESGVKTLICTDISKDGVMSGANLSMYRELQASLGADIVASGGISSLDDVTALRDMGLYGAILGRSLYVGAIDLAEAVKICSGGET